MSSETGRDGERRDTPADRRGVVPEVPALRVFEPLQVFAVGAQEHWSRLAEFAEGGRVAKGQEAIERPGGSRERSLRQLLAVPPLLVPPPESTAARLLRRGTDVFVCPEDAQLRAWEAVATLRETYAPRVLDAFVPAVVIDAAARDYARWRERFPDVRPHVRSAGWQIPHEWFALVDDSERMLCQGVGDEPRSLTYVSEMSAVRRRAARALRTLQQASAGHLVDRMAELAMWLEAFHPRSWVELDYGDVARLVPWEDLLADRSAADVADGLAALAEGDGGRSRERRAELLSRWGKINALARLN